MLARKANPFRAKPCGAVTGSHSPRLRCAHQLLLSDAVYVSVEELALAAFLANSTWRPFPPKVQLDGK
jgi:hypothetical protein